MEPPVDYFLIAIVLLAFLILLYCTCLKKEKATNNNKPDLGQQLDLDYIKNHPFFQLTMLTDDSEYWNAAFGGQTQMPFYNKIGKGYEIVQSETFNTAVKFFDKAGGEIDGAPSERGTVFRINLPKYKNNFFFTEDWKKPVLIASGGHDMYDLSEGFHLPEGMKYYSEYPMDEDQYDEYKTSLEEGDMM